MSSINTGASSSSVLDRLATAGRSALTSSTLVSILSAFALGGVMILITGSDPITGFSAMFSGAFGTGIGLANTLSKTTMIICFGLATAIAFRAGILNLGTEGQAVLGALAGGIVALHMPEPGFLVLTAALITAIIVGAMWGLVAALLENYMGVPILISTLLLNYPARFFSSWLIRYKLKDPASDLPASRTFAEDTMLQYFVPRGSAAAKSLAQQFGGTSPITGVLTGVNWSLIIVAVLVVFVIFLNNRTRYGFESGLAGQNPQFTRYSGVQPEALVVKTMALSGGIAGLAGILLVLGQPSTRMLEGHVVTTGYAFTALLVTLLANYKPIPTVLSGLFFAGIIVGSAALGRELSLSPQISAIIQALVIIFIAFKVGLPQFKKRPGKSVTEEVAA
ncbi:ABC transporter permease [Canibacter zhuwentaonis]|uniref:ABC transporter permease n=1 Tax=Canibacter zhuwentaonis TaxID=2837491 RepID=UPI0032B4036C